MWEVEQSPSGCDTWADVDLPQLLRALQAQPSSASSPVRQPQQPPLGSSQLGSSQVPPSPDGPRSYETRELAERMALIKEHMIKVNAEVHPATLQPCVPATLQP